jgi:stearoyl-CoA desaturase (delta-9 desaturase)
MDLSFKMISEIPSLIKHHHNAGTINWPMSRYVTAVHIMGLVGLTKVMDVKRETLLLAFLLWPISGLGITVGAHRLWSHRSFTASFPVRVFLMLCNSIACQQTIYKWVRDHRVHHKHSETNADPHNATRGFFFAHLGWLYVKKHPDVIKAGKEIDMKDLQEDPVVMFQKRLDPVLNLYMCFVLPAQVAVKFWGESFWPAFFVAGALRYIFVLHCTSLVNSAAHLYGDHPYENTHPAENPIVSFFAIGEGWHNWHHRYPFDYAASELGISSQYNPSKLFIDMLAAVGLVWGRKRGTAMWNITKARRAEEVHEVTQFDSIPPVATSSTDSDSSVTKESDDEDTFSADDGIIPAGAVKQE